MKKRLLLAAAVGTATSLASVPSHAQVVVIPYSPYAISNVSPVTTTTTTLTKVDDSYNTEYSASYASSTTDTRTNTTNNTTSSNQSNSGAAGVAQRDNGQAVTAANGIAQGDNGQAVSGYANTVNSLVANGQGSFVASESSVNTTTLSGAVSGNAAVSVPVAIGVPSLSASIGSSSLTDIAGITQVAQNVGTNGLIQQGVGVSAH